MPSEPFAAAVATKPMPRGLGEAEICRQKPRDTRADSPMRDLFAAKVSQLAWSASWPIANMPGSLPAKIVPVTRASPLASALSVSSSLAKSRSTPMSALHRSLARSTSMAPIPTGSRHLRRNTSAATRIPASPRERCTKTKPWRVAPLLTERLISRLRPAASASRSTFHPPRCGARSVRTSVAPPTRWARYQSSSRISWGLPLGSGRFGAIPPAWSRLMSRSS